ncbi:hypothetical protein [Flavisolibacter ginsengisoli]|uniref:Cytochrome C and Quinol oxidase polypeptide I n=1 Tax=Flavisolibacter ginsengisoli DSM 18119 TaxID=1121884 RepID=A0A1M5CQT5_9BACT|nr:hypothetical protein [Flavisolibacter ginsengisoli]SHF56732.1 hypothetical protein SAMN02745131_02973 [Flavisolibacter ginsengisoli DSM 18119]
MMSKKYFWVGLCLVNLCIVALLGVTLRSKIVFSIPMIDYRQVLSAHSHFAFGGWVGLSLMTLLVFDVLPVVHKKYIWILASIEVSSLGMGLLFPFFGYAPLTVTFSSLYIVASFVFAWMFLKDLLKTSIHNSVKLLGVSAIASMVLSSLGPLGLSYILLSGSGNSLLYRDSIYTFLHFQYNGFFTLSVFTLVLNDVIKKNYIISVNAKRFALFLSISVLPSLFLSMLWHNSTILYIIAGIGCIFILISLFYFLKFILEFPWDDFYDKPLALNMWKLAAFSFGLKMALNVGTIFPTLGNAIYGNRPVIIGFLHLVFLGFVSFFILSSLVENNFFKRKNKQIKFPFFLFGFGIIANESLLMLQGLEILFKTNSSLYSWLLWGVSIILLLGALSIMLSYLTTDKYNTQKKMAVL